MARNGSGTMSVVNTFTSQTTISSSGHNQNYADIAAEITNSLPRDGQAGMLAALKLYDGTAALPGLAFTGDPNSGLYRIGADNLGVACNGAKVLDIATTGLGITGALSVTGAFSPGSLSGTIGGTPTINTVWTFSGAPEFTGSPVFKTGTPNFQNGAALAGTFTGTPTFSGNIALSGTPVFSAGATLGTGTFAGNAIFSGNITFSGTPVFSNPVTLKNASKAWGYVTFSGGTPTLQTGGQNIASITDEGDGDITFTLTAGMSDTNYVVVGTAGAASNPRIVTVKARQTGSFRVGVYNTSGSLVDPENLSVAVFGA